MTTRFLAFETAGLLNQASEPHSVSSRLTCDEVVKLSDICPVSFTEESAIVAR
jgi:hypothetical protein